MDEISNYPWVFWISITFRPKWFKRFWKARGANNIEYQFLIFKISIGRPWLRSYIECTQKDFGSAKNIHQANKENLKRLFSLKCTPKMPKKGFIGYSGTGYIGRGDEDTF